MILALNYAFWVLIALVVFGAVQAYRVKHPALKYAFVTLALFSAFFAFLVRNAVSYTPKGEVPALSNPAFEPSDAEMQDRLKKPDENHEEKLEEKLDWKQQIEDTKAQSNAKE